MRTGRGFERLITFADAVVAIALTLLVLPLVEIPAALEGSGDVGEVIVEHRGELFAFLVSFVVISALWSVHHRTMEYFAGYDQVVLRLTMVWLMTIVVLPFTTQLIQTEAHQDGAVPVYIGVLLVSSLSLLALSAHGRRHPELLATGPEIDRWVNEPVTAVTTGLLAVALVLSIVFPQVGTWPLLLLVLDDTIEALWLRFRGRSS